MDSRRPEEIDLMSKTDIDVFMQLNFYFFSLTLNGRTPLSPVHRYIMIDSISRDFFMQP